MKPFIPNTVALPQEELDLLAGLGHKLPKGAAIHFVNIRNQWRHSRNRYIACSAYADAWGISAVTVRKVVRAIAALEGLAAVTAYEDGRKIGLRLVNDSGVVRQVSDSGSSAVAKRYACVRQTHASASPNDSGVGRSTIQESEGQRLRSRSIDDSINKTNKQEQDLSREVSRPIDAGGRKSIIEEAVRLYDMAQRQHGGVLTDDATVANLLQQSAGLTDDAVAHACATALYSNHAWAWCNDSASAYSAGEALSGAINGRLDDPEAGITCTPDAGEGFLWDANHGTFVDLSLGCHVQEAMNGASTLDDPSPCPVEAPAALDKGKTPTTSQDASEAILEPSQRRPAPNPVTSLLTAAAQTSQQPPNQDPSPAVETHESHDAHMARLHAKARLQATQLAASSSFSTGRYGVPAPHRPTVDLHSEF